MSPFSDWYLVVMVLAGIGSDVWHHPYMTKIYQWTTDDDELADNAIIVSIGGTDSNMVVNYGLSYFPPGAQIVWLGMFTRVGFFEAGWEDCFDTIPDALARAEVLKEQMGADRVVISIQEYGMWRDEWGELAEKEGLG